MPNGSTGCTPFLTAYGQQPKQIMDITTVPSKNAVVKNIVQNSRKIHEQVQESLKQTNEKYKEEADKSKRFKTFEMGDSVAVHLLKDRQPACSYSKLKARNFGPCEILRKINDNVYVIDIPAEYNMSPTFNVSELKKYYLPETEDAQLRIIALGEGLTDVKHLSNSVL